MALGDYLIIGIVLLCVISGISIRKDEHKKKHTRYDLYLESADGETTQIATNQRAGWFYILNDFLCYFDGRSIKKYLRIESGSSIYVCERELQN